MKSRVPGWGNPPQSGPPKFLTFKLKRRFLKVLKSVEISFEINALENFEIDLVYFRLQFKSSITVFQYLRQLETSKQFFFFKK